MRLAQRFGIALVWAALPLHGQAQLTPQQIHDAIDSIIRSRATRAIAAGDTFVTWSPSPVLYSTVQRANDRVTSSLLRNDAMVGTMEARWAAGAPTRARLRWTQQDSVLLDLTFTVEGGRIRAGGTRSIDMPVPSLPWAIADYGMEDQLLPILSILPADSMPRAVVVYRPFPAKWDTLQVTAYRHRGWLRATLRDSDGEDFFWVVTNDGALLRITRSKHADDERAPLVASPRWADYVRFSNDSL